MPRLHLLRVLAFTALLSVSVSLSVSDFPSSSVSASSSVSSSSLSRAQEVRLRELEHRLEELTERVNLSGDVRSKENLAEAGECPMAALHRRSHSSRSRRSKLQLPRHHPQIQQQEEEEEQEEEQQEEATEDEESSYDDEEDGDGEDDSASADSASKAPAAASNLKKAFVAKRTANSKSKSPNKKKVGTAVSKSGSKRPLPQRISSWEPTPKSQWESFSLVSTDADSGTATGKASAIWSLISANPNGVQTWPNKLGLMEMLLPSMEMNRVMMTTYFDVYQGDVYQLDGVKMIHSQGVHAMGELVWNKKLPYTGLFQSGSTNAVIRLSSAKDPGNTAVTAGVSLKLFRTGLPSSNSMFLHSFQGKVWSFFDQNLQNHVTSVIARGDPTALIFKKFQTASTYAFYTGLSDWAAADENGNLTPRDQIKFPFQLILVPNADLQRDFASLRPDGKPYFTQFDSIPPGSNLYSIYIQDEPFSDPYPAGELNLKGDSTGKLMTSNYGDLNLFFKHQRFEEDFVFRPDWKNTCSTPQMCEYMYPLTK